MKDRFVSWLEISGHVQELARQIALSKWRPDIIVGVTRGGAIPAVMLSHYFKCQMVGLSVSLRDYQNTPWNSGPESNCWLPEDATNGCQILIVDDINDSGNTINWIKKDWESSAPEVANLWHKGIRTAMLFNKPTSKAELEIDYVSEEIHPDNCDQWIIFEYEAWWRNYPQFKS